MIIKIIATITGILLSLGYYPQLWKIFRTKSAKDISIPSFIIFGTGTLSWFIYGWYLHDIVIMLSFGFGVIGSWTILFLTFYYREKV